MQKPGLKQLIQEIHRRSLWQVLGICLLAVSTPLLAGEQGRTTEQIVAECDRLAASPYDPERKAKGVETKDIDAAAAIEACRQAVGLHATPRLQYQYGRSLTKNEENEEQNREGATWYRKAAEQGYAPAQTNLGLMYARGRVFSKNDVESVNWYRKAADQGYAPAQRSLGWMYANGRGVTKNDEEAVQWYRKAADQGYARAQTNLGVRYARGGGVTMNDAEAVKWYRKAAEQGDARAQTRLSGMYA